MTFPPYSLVFAVGAPEIRFFGVRAPEKIQEDSSSRYWREPIGFRLSAQDMKVLLAKSFNVFSKTIKLFNWHEWIWRDREVPVRVLRIKWAPGELLKTPITQREDIMESTEKELHERSEKTSVINQAIKSSEQYPGYPQFPITTVVSLWKDAPATSLADKPIPALQEELDDFATRSDAPEDSHQADFVADIDITEDAITIQNPEAVAAAIALAEADADLG